MAANPPLPFKFDDGGRAAAGFKGLAGDCVIRSIAIACQVSYEDVYEQLTADLRKAKATARARSKASRYPTTPRDGTPMPVIHDHMRRAGWVWHPTMRVGEGTTVHLADGELPAGRLVVRCSKHLTAVVDGVIHDTHDPGRDGTRAVYGYWYDPNAYGEA